MKAVLLFTFLFLTKIIFSQCPTEILPSDGTLCSITYTIDVALNSAVTIISNNASRIETREMEDGGPWTEWDASSSIGQGHYGIIEVRSTADSDGGAANITSIQQGVPSCQDGVFEIEYTTTNSDEGTCSGLPIQFFEALKVKFTEGMTILSWSVFQQINNEKFLIQHSTDANDFDQIGEVKGAGNTHEIIGYEFIHKNPFPGMNYYRIKQVDFDGKYSFSEVVSVNFDGVEMTIFPNPGEGEIKVNSPGADRLIIYNQYGKINTGGGIGKRRKSTGFGSFTKWNVYF